MNLYVYNLPVILVTLFSMPVPIVVWFLFLCKRLPMKLLHKLLRKLDMVERGPEDSDEKPQSTLHGHEVPMFSVLMFLMYLASICLIISMVFINTLLVQRTMSCDADVDCFLVDISTSFDLSEQDLYTTPVSCNNLTDDSVFICYKFQFDLANALAVAGGLITIAKLTINITLSVLSWLMNRQTEKRNLMVAFIIIFSSFMLCPFFLIAYSMLEIFCKKRNCCVFINRWYYTFYTAISVPFYSYSCYFGCGWCALSNFR